jgi:hypothetical protein
LTAIADLFEDRGWEDVYYRDTNLFVWGNPDFPGLMIDVAVGGNFTVLAGDPLRKGKVGRLTAFDDAATAIAFCERAAPLADWRKPASGPHRRPRWTSNCTRSPSRSPGHHELLAGEGARPASAGVGGGILVSGAGSSYREVAARG